MGQVLTADARADLAEKLSAGQRDAVNAVLTRIRGVGPPRCEASGHSGRFRAIVNPLHE